MPELDPLEELMTWLMISDAPPEGWTERWSQRGGDPLVAAWEASASPSAMFSALWVSKHPGFQAAKGAMSYEEGITRSKARVANAMRAQVGQPPLLADVLSRWEPQGPLVKLERALESSGEPAPPWVERWSASGEPLAEALEASGRADVVFLNDLLSAARGEKPKSSYPKESEAELRSMLAGFTLADVVKGWRAHGRRKPIAPRVADLDAPEFRADHPRRFKPVSQLGLPEPVVARLLEHGLRTASHLTDKTAWQLDHEVNLSEASIQKLRDALLELDMYLHHEQPKVETPPEPAATSWGCLFARGDEAAVGAAVEQAYASVGLRRVEVAKASKQSAPLKIRKGPLGPDDVLVMEDEEDWTAVASDVFEWAPPGEHPLALPLSRSFEVLSIASLGGRYIEASVYREGRLAEAAWAGPKLPKLTGLSFAPLDLSRLQTSAFTTADLKQRLDQADADELAKGFGTECRGSRETAELMTLDDVGEERLWVFRKAV